MTYVTCSLTDKHRDQLRNPMPGNGVWATFTFNNNKLMHLYSPVKQQNIIVSHAIKCDDAADDDDVVNLSILWIR